MRIAILGTRGIPNQYGGFERFAEVISTFLAKAGHSVTVLAPSTEKLQKQNYQEGVDIEFIKVPNWLPQNIQTLHYDLKSLIWASNSNIDIILECGYSYAIWLIFFPNSYRKKIVTNPDGIEFNRNKWGFFAKLFLKSCEVLSVKLTKAIVCDNPALVSHYENIYNISPTVIPYGAFPLDHYPKSTIFNQYGISDNYFLTISRFTPENNIDIILECFSKTRYNLVLVGNYHNKYGKSCFAKYGNFPNIKFLGGIYNQEELDALRFHSKAYIHGHSVGGTNPSLLEAMACKCFIIAHDNNYNRVVLDNRGLFFHSFESLNSVLIDFNNFDEKHINLTKNKNYDRIGHDFSWQLCADKYLKVFNRV